MSVTEMCPFKDSLNEMIQNVYKVPSLILDDMRDCKGRERVSSVPSIKL